MRRRTFVVNEEGAAIVEFALVVPLLIGLALGIVVLGQMFYTVNSLSAAVREGARYAAVQPAVTRDSVAARVVRSFRKLGGDALDPASEVSVTQAGDQITVTATYPMTAMGTTYTINITQSAVYRWEMGP